MLKLIKKEKVLSHLYFQPTLEKAKNVVRIFSTYFENNLLKNETTVPAINVITWYNLFFGNLFVDHVLNNHFLVACSRSEVDLARGVGDAPPFFCNHSEELQTVLTEVKLIIYNAHLTYVYPNTIKICLTINHLFFGRQLLYYSNTTSTVVRNLTVLWSTTDRINQISNHFWYR